MCPTFHSFIRCIKSFYYVTASYFCSYSYVGYFQSVMNVLSSENLPKHRPHSASCVCNLHVPKYYYSSQATCTSRIVATPGTEI